MLLELLLRGRAAAGGACAAEQLLSGGWAQAAGQQRWRHYVPALEQAPDGRFSADETYKHWRAAWKAPRGRAPPPRRGPAVPLDPEERSLLRDSAAAAGLPPRAAHQVVVGVEAGALPIDPVALTQRVQALGELAGDDPGLAPARLLAGRDGAALLSVPTARLRRQLDLLARLLPDYKTEWLLTALPRWSLHGPGVVAKRLGEVERLYERHLGVPFPRHLLGQRGREWRWLTSKTPRTKTVAVLELIVLVGPQLAARMLTACPQLLSLPPDRAASALRAVSTMLGISEPEAAELLSPQPAVLLRDPLGLEAAAYGLLQLVGDDRAAALELLRRQPSLLLFSGTDWEEKLQLLGAVLGLAGGDARPRLLEAVAAAPNLLTRSPAALQASWVALRDALGKETARQVLLGAEQGPAGGAPRLLAYSAAALSGRAATLQQLSELSADWQQRVDAARREPAALAAVLGAREGASGRLAWLVASGQRLAPGGVGLPELLALDDAGFADIYPLWHAREGAGAA